MIQPFETCILTFFHFHFLFSHLILDPNTALGFVIFLMDFVLTSLIFLFIQLLIFNVLFLWISFQFTCFGFYQKIGSIKPLCFQGLHYLKNRCSLPMEHLGSRGWLIVLRNLCFQAYICNIHGYVFSVLKRERDVE